MILASIVLLVCLSGLSCASSQFNPFPRDQYHAASRKPFQEYDLYKIRMDKEHALSPRDEKMKRNSEEIADSNLVYHDTGYLTTAWFNSVDGTYDSCTGIPTHMTVEVVGICVNHQRITVTFDTATNTTTADYIRFDDENCQNARGYWSSSTDASCSNSNSVRWSADFPIQGLSPDHGYLHYGQMLDSLSEAGDCSGPYWYESYMTASLCNIPPNGGSSNSNGLIIAEDGSIFKTQSFYDDDRCSSNASVTYLYPLPSGCQDGSMFSFVENMILPTGSTLGPVYLKESGYYESYLTNCATTPDNVTFYGDLEVCVPFSIASSSSVSTARSQDNTLEYVKTTFASTDCSGEVLEVSISHVELNTCSGGFLRELVSSVEPPSLAGFLEQQFESTEQCNIDAPPRHAIWLPTDLCRTDRSMFTCEDNAVTRSYYDYYSADGCTGLPYAQTTESPSCNESSAISYFFGAHSYLCTAATATPQPSKVPSAMPSPKPSLRPTAGVSSTRPTKKPHRKRSPRPNRKPTAAPTVELSVSRGWIFDRWRAWFGKYVNATA